MSSGRVASVWPTTTPGQVVVDEHGAVAGVPVERDQPVRADGLFGGQFGEQLVHVEAALGGRGV